MNNRPTYKPLYILLTVLAFAIITGFILQRPYRFHGLMFQPPLPVADFSLQSANGEVFRLSDQSGTFILLFFGYTSCPDVCPVTMATFREVYEGLKQDAEKVKFVMITADPDRDTPDNVAEYAVRFNPAFIGLGGDPKQLEAVRNELGVFVQKEAPGASTNYLVSHTASIFVLDQNGNLIMTFPYGTKAVDIEDDLLQLIKQAEQQQGF